MNGVMPLNKIYIHAFNRLQCIGPKGLMLLSEFFGGDFSAAWKASETAIGASGISAETADSIYKKRQTIDPEAEYEKLITSFGEPIATDDTLYPAILREIPHPPLLLYIRGALTASGTKIAVVGTRRPTAYGREIARLFSDDIARTGCTIVSGLALGIDGIAHEAAVRCSAPTIAVVGSGADDESLYPQDHTRLAKKIVESGGAVISEFPPGTPALKHHFPQRNRIIAGLSQGTLVVEAREKSGALITARYALEYNRDVFAVPGPLFSAPSAGPNMLIRDGAHSALTADDVLSLYGITAETDRRQGAEGELESKIIAFLDHSVEYDELLSLVGATPSVLNTALAMLELKNCVKNIGNRTYIRI